MLERGTSNTINSNPNGGKTTLYCQAVRAHLYKEDFFLKSMTFPSGRIAFVQTDRSIERYKNLLIPMGLYQHSAIEIINFVDEPSFHELTKPVQSKDIPRHIELLRTAITARLTQKDISTVIFDLDPFQRATSSSDAGYYSRSVAIWAKEQNFSVLLINYPFKQTTAKQALRTQDRSSGFLHAQASQDWKFTIIDSEENDTPYHILSVRKPSGSGSREEHMVLRGTEEEGDFIGLYRLYTGPRIPTVVEIMKERKCDYDEAWRIRKRLLAGDAYESL